MGMLRMLVCAVGGMLLASAGVRAEDPPAGGDAGKPRKSAEEVAKMLETFKAVKDTTPEGADLYLAITVLAEAEHPDVVKPLAKHLADPRERVGRGAAVALARVGKALTPKERKPVLTALSSAIGFTGARAPVAAEAIRALGQLGEVAVAPSLIPLIEAKDNGTAKAAVEALALLPSAAAIDPLCSELMKLEPLPRGSGDGSASGASTGGNYGAGGVGEGLGARITALKEPILKTLNALTGKSFQTSLEWRKWWKTAKATWKVRVPETPTTEPRPG